MIRVQSIKIYPQTRQNGLAWLLATSCSRVDIWHNIVMASPEIYTRSSHLQYFEKCVPGYQYDFLADSSTRPNIEDAPIGNKGAVAWLWELKLQACSYFSFHWMRAIFNASSSISFGNQNLNHIQLWSSFHWRWWNCIQFEIQWHC